jgi:hypothetical protein
MLIQYPTRVPVHSMEPDVSMYQTISSTQKFPNPSRFPDRLYFGG